MSTAAMPKRPGSCPPLKASDVSPGEWRLYRYGCPLEAALDVLAARGRALEPLLLGLEEWGQGLGTEAASQASSGGAEVRLAAKPRQ